MNKVLLAKLLEAENAFSEAHRILAECAEDMILGEKDMTLVERLHDDAYGAMVDLANRRMDDKG